MPDDLEPLASQVGITADDFLRLTESDEFEDVVDFDLQISEELQIQGVPFFVFNQAVAVAGAESEEILEAAIAKARELAETETPME
jgi:predicted DsbA family dithiol-disulfide isomerase